MIQNFNFIGFSPNENLREKSNLVLNRLLELAPYGSVAVALLEKDARSYGCSIEIYSEQGPFTARCHDDSPEVALENVTRSLSQKLEHWKEVRKLKWKERNNKTFYHSI
jgi:hypothetical protein